MNDLAGHFRVGNKVKLRGDHGYERGATGTIAYPPGIATFYDESGEMIFRKRLTEKGEKTYLWVVFDEPQLAHDEDGPYVSAEIEVDNLELFEE